MEENMQTEAIADTTPESASHAETQTQETVEGTPQPETAESAEGSENQETAQANEEDVARPFLQIKYNHEERGLSEQEAAKLAQIGLKVQESEYSFERAKPLLDKLDYFAAQKGVSMEEAMDSLLQNEEEEHRRQLLEKFGDDESVVGDLMRVFRDGQKEKYQKIIDNRKEAREKAAEENRQRLESRLADEFLELKSEFPDIQDFASLPEVVKRQAAEGRDLLSCYLRYRHKNEVQKEKAQEAAQAAAKATTGSMSDSAQDGQTEAEKQFLKGLWR